jgi:Zn-dependent peptidase ImmA (M78 family)
MKSSYSVDSDGVPFLGRNDLEDKAEEVIRFWDEGLLHTPKSIPLLEICQKLEREFQVQFHYDADLGVVSGDKKKVLGKCLPDAMRIYIDRSLSDQLERFNFTLAHELAHLTLHRGLSLKKPLEQDTDERIERDLVTGRKLLRTPNDRIEWQANALAAAILMPRATVRHSVLIRQKEIGVNNNAGFVFVENIPYSIRDLEDMKSWLSLVYHVSRTVAEYRMDNLGILIDRRNQSVKHISELLRKNED